MGQKGIRDSGGSAHAVSTVMGALIIESIPASPWDSTLGTSEIQLDYQLKTFCSTGKYVNYS